MLGRIYVAKIHSNIIPMIYAVWINDRQLSWAKCL